MKDFAQDVDREKTGREAAPKSTKDKVKAVDVAKKKAVAAEKARVLAEERSVELEAKHHEMDLKLAKEMSRNTALTEEVVDLRAALEAAENKWYDEGFANAEKGVELVVKEARQLSFQDGLMAALHALEVPEDSPLRDPGKIPFPEVLPSAQNLPRPGDEEETDSLRELVEQIDAHVEMVGTEATSNPLSENMEFQNLASDSQLPEMRTGTHPWILPNDCQLLDILV